MQRYFIANNQLTELHFSITGEDVKHISKVMRMSQGDQLICINEDGIVAQCKIVAITNDEINGTVLKILTEDTELPVKVTVAQGLPKGDKLELIVQKGTELGATAFIPFQATRSIVKWDEKKGQKKIERLGKIAKEAAEQSYRRIVPKVMNSLSFKQLVKESEHYDIKIVAYEEKAKQGEMKNLAAALGQAEVGNSILVVVGPEGGLTIDEITVLEQMGFTSCSFGPRILRTETAAMYFLGAVSYHFEMLR
ncbi:16S rRNA (uracil(1498)-N(3))-methyltransferase [Anaerobacillus isosaccharinicus]|uniref:Ribosomal RNA small subunit methyltransferase E n=1 Tax=Anaerobacillus isosaccharinicus TaxID=1532552 RepID=A0A1S2LS95_9BACI|nr:16S rRNA (uracil(1498)-N(3))-methyltransferase [Anaerobacillus isosaccharinicus]MBA5585489.1 16S rRNA (uracil(1498)-N(3))-methyltransferase [Anaerobacillus isosaccharinicus]QOY36194.1 16S rRNA (uracil(1498)-N(3))-methyltransferase [Anaerobacillus isosaccharinicus]